MEAAAGIFYYQDPPDAMSLSMAPSLGRAGHVRHGDYLQIYVTGLGKATANGDPAGAILPTGTVAPASGNPLYLTLAQPTVTIGGQPAPVLFSGIGPGFSGLHQVNVQIPTNIAPGDDVPLVITILGSTDSATVAIQ